MPELEIPDAHERAQALDTSASFLVEAPAGSGKTGLLIQRYLKLLAIVDDPAEVLAITFTRKATAEMQERVLAQLLGARAGTPPANPFDRATRPFAEAVLARDAERGWHLIDSPRSLRIRTIDSVATDIARSLPILSGSGGGQQPSDDAALLHAEAAQRTLMLLGSPGNPQLDEALRTLLLHRDGNLANCRALLAEMLGTRDQWGELVPLAAAQLTDEALDGELLPRLERALEDAICRALTRLTELLPPAILARLCALAAEMAASDGYRGAPSPIAICRMRQQPPEERAEDLDHWRALIHLVVKPSKPRDWRKSLSGNHIGFEIQKNHQAELKLIIAELSSQPHSEAIFEELCQLEALPPAQYPPEQWLVTKALFRVLARALVELQFVFAARNQCDFAELGLLARAALRRDSALDDLHTSAGVRLQHLLVDEMQDTSSAQYELIHLLTRRWDGGSQTVFLVGDPKQSIYLFRQARVERFVRTQHLRRLGDVPLTPLHLTANFRSQSTLVRHFNQDFQQIFPALTLEPPDNERCATSTERSKTERGREHRSTEHSTPNDLVPYRAAHAMRGPSTAQARVWHAEALPYSKDSAAAAAFRIGKAREHAQLTATIAARWLEDPGTTLAVLVRTRNYLLDLVKAFRAAGIPYRAVEIEPLAERQEILDLLALTRALLHPADRTAWLSLLRAPWCGLTLPDLHTLTGQDDRALAGANLVDLLATRGELLSPDGIARLQPFWLTMQTALAQRGTLPVSTLVARTWHAFAAPAVLPPEALANAAHFFALLDQLEAETGTLSHTELDRKLKKLYATPAAAASTAAVDLMTIHKSKGLEWDVVFVPALERIGRVTTGRLLGWLELDAGEAEDTAHGILAPIQARGDAAHQLTAWMRSIESAREAAERKRLFYVACTRAREELHLFAAPALNAKGEIKPKSDSLLHASWAAAEPHLQLPASAPDQQPTMAPVLHFPTPVTLDLAAAAEPGAPGLAPETWDGSPQTPPQPFRVVERIPLHLLPTAVGPAEPAAIPQSFPRPEGSFAARSFGNTTHAFLDELTSRLAAGFPLAEITAELPAWSPRVRAVLRASGLAPGDLPARTAEVLRALRNTLADPTGQWLLHPPPAAQTESTLTGVASTLRLDRTFLAGATPGSSGQTHLWIVDYKTGTHAQSNVQDFLAREQQKYTAQLQTYAEALSAQTLPLRVALYYPLLPALVWGEPAGGTILWQG